MNARRFEIWETRTKFKRFALVETSLHGVMVTMGGQMEGEVEGGGERGWFGNEEPPGTSRIERRAISFADCRYRQPLSKISHSQTPRAHDGLQTYLLLPCPYYQTRRCDVSSSPFFFVSQATFPFPCFLPTIVLFPRFFKKILFQVCPLPEKLSKVLLFDEASIYLEGWILAILWWFSFGGRWSGMIGVVSKLSVNEEICIELKCLSVSLWGEII